LFTSCLFFPAILFAQKFEGLAATPPMGWNSWNSFQTKINEQVIMETADRLVATGMKDAGYLYLVLDDAWMGMERDSSGNLVADPQKFPRGMKPVADYVHSKGLKFGLYNCAGTLTCAGYPGTRGYEYQDARYYASMGIDYLKFDWCNTEGLNPKEAYTTMSKALRKAGRPIVFSLCEWGNSKPWEWAAPVGQLWRTTGDIGIRFDSVLLIDNKWTALSVMRIADMQTGLRKYAGPGHWNDPDMLEVGNGMTVNEDRTHFSLWCMLAAPLIAGNDLRKMTKETVAILTNKNAIAIDQDALGIEGFRYRQADSLETWFRPLDGGDWAVCFVNRSAAPKQLRFDWKKEMVNDTLAGRWLETAAVYKLTDVWTGRLLGNTGTVLQWALASHDVLMIRMRMSGPGNKVK
jgi:alpha-galactosidase